MKTSNVIVGIAVIGLIAWIAWLLLGSKGSQSRVANTNGSTNQDSTQPSQVPATLTRIVKNEQNTLSLISYNSVTNEITNSRILSFTEATRLVGASNVCLGPPNGRYGANGYSECSVIRTR